MLDAHNNSEDVKSTLKMTQTLISQEYGSGVQSIFKIGTLLRDAKSKTYKIGKKQYETMLENLPFASGQADKYISIVSCDWMNDLVETKPSHFPNVFTTLYQLTQKTFVEVETFNVVMKEGFDKGFFIIPKDNTTEQIVSSKVTLNDVKNAVGHYWKTHTITPEDAQVEENELEAYMQNLKEITSTTSTNEDSKSDETEVSKLDKSKFDNIDKLSVLDISIPIEVFKYKYDAVLELKSKIESLVNKSKKDFSVDFNEKDFDAFVKYSEIKTAVKQMHDKSPKTQLEVANSDE